MTRQKSEMKGRSLKTRITLATLVISLICVWSLELLVSRILREDVQSLLGEHQMSMISLMSENINGQMVSRLRLLERSASRVSPLVLANVEAMTNFLESNAGLQDRFNGGIVICKQDGTVVAEFPVSARRIGMNLAGVGALVSTLEAGKSTFGRPVIDPASLSPILAMTVPIRDSHGKVIGAMAGITNLAVPNFLDGAMKTRYGDTGGFLLFSPKHGMIVTASDKGRIMEALPAHGVNVAIDRFTAGYVGTELFVNPLGVEVITSDIGVPAPEWVLATLLPTAEAFAPIYLMQQRMVLATAALTILAAILTWWMLKREFAPMHATVKTLARMVDSRQFALPLPTFARHDELNELIGGFNQLQEMLVHREAALEESEQRLFKILENVDAYIYLKDAQGRYLFVNRPVRELFGVAMDEIIGQSDEKFFNAAAVAQIQISDRRVLDEGETIRAEETHGNLRDGNTPTYLTVKLPLRNEAGEIYAICGISTDISTRKLVERTIKDNEQRLEYALDGAGEGVWDLNLQTGETLYSPRWREILGYADHEIGNHAAEWKRLVHPDDLSNAMAVVQSHLDGKTPSIKHDFRMLCKDGRYKWILGRGTLVSRDADGKPLRLVGTTADLSERKRTEAQLIEITEILREQVNLRITRLRETSMKLTMTEERERRSLAQELHDNIGQLLAIIKIKLTPLVLRKVAPSLDEIMGLVEKVDQSVRMVTRQLSPPILNTLGFGPAVAWLADEMQSMYGLSVLFDDATGAVALVDGVEAVLYRSVRELLINVAKHAKASHARVSFHRDDDRVVLVVSDDGCGFDSANFHETLAGTHSFGLSSIYERVINIGGVMDIVSSHGLGTTVTLAMPCAIAVKEYQLS